MLRHPRFLARIAALAALAVATAGCGIKGPLTLPPKPDGSAQAPADPAKRDGQRAPEPKL